MEERSELGSVRRPRAGRGSRAAAALVALPLVVGAWSPAALHAQFGDPLITSIRFEGNTAFSSDELRLRILTRETECRSFILEPFCLFGADFAKDFSYLRRLALPEDAARLRLYYGRRGYRQAAVDTVVSYAADSTAVDITFRIAENEPVRVNSLEVSGLEGFDPAVGRGLQTRLGGTLDQVALDADRDTLQERLWNRGHAHAEVFVGSFIPAANPTEAEVTLDVFPGPVARFGEVSVEGTGVLTPAVVRRMLPFQEGALYRREAVLSGQRNLYGLEIIRSASVQVDLDHTPDTIVPVRVVVSEGDPRIVNFGGGLSSADCVNAEARWTHRNLAGGARRLQLRASVSNVGSEDLRRLCSDAGTGAYSLTNWSVGGELTLPRVGGPRNSASFTLSYEKQSLQDVFIREAYGATAGVTRSLGRGDEALTLAWRPAFAKLQATELFFCVSFLVCDPEDIDELSDFNWLAPVALTFSRTRTDQVFNPTRGSTLLVDVEHARNWTRSAFEYDRVIGEAAWYRALGRDVIFATRFRFGVVEGRGFSQQVGTAVASAIHPEKRFYLGGANTVRGYAQGQLGPRVLTVPVLDLLGTAGNAPCLPEEIANRSCDATALSEGRFQARPTGGSELVVANAEFRIWLAPAFQAATFLDLGQVWSDADDISLSNLAFSPGLGLRYFSPVGPIRVDLGYRLTGGERLRVVTDRIRAFDPEIDLPSARIQTRDGVVLPFVRTDELAVLIPEFLFEDSDRWSLDRLQFHISIGQAF